MQNSQSAQDSVGSHPPLQPAPGASGAGIEPFHRVTDPFQPSLYLGTVGRAWL